MLAALRVAGGLAALLGLLMPLGLRAEDAAPSLATNFQIGTGESICSAQDALFNKARSNVFDRSWTIVCRDATRPVGQIHKLSGKLDRARIETARLEPLDCSAAGAEAIEDLGSVATRNCRSTLSGARWKSYQVERAGKQILVEGVAGYDSALRLALRSVVQDRALSDPIAMPTLDSSAGGSFYRLQAAQSDPATRLEQGYRSNNAGAFAAAVEFFDFGGTAGVAGERQSADSRNLLHEMLINRALQLSNLGKFGEADAAFSRARATQVTDPVQLRLARNLEAMHEINQGVLGFAQAILKAPMPRAPGLADNADGATLIGSRINAPLAAGGRTGAGAFSLAQSLSVAERATLLDAQASQLEGTTLRMAGNDARALERLDAAVEQASTVRGGRVVAAYRLRAQIMTEKALLLERQGKLDEAEASLRRVHDLIADEYPESMATQASTAGLAAFFARHDRKAEALVLYRGLAKQLVESRSRLVGLTNRIAPYFDLLSGAMGQDPDAASDMFLIVQTLARPGAASTLEQLSRSMEAGDDRGAALYRQSTGLRRDIERAMIQIAQLNADQNLDAEERAASIAVLKAAVDQLSAQQVRTLDDLAGFSRFRAISSATVSLPDMLALLEPGEAYLKVAAIGDSLYAVYLSERIQTGWKLPISARALKARVAQLRDSISITINGVQSTYPFDVDAARALYIDLFGPVDADLKAVRHLIFEPDGALLQLPINLLVADQASVDAYHQRMTSADADPYDFTGIAWLGRNRSVSTALSAASFRDVRRLPPSTATRAYLGLGRNARVDPTSLPDDSQRLRGMGGLDGADMAAGDSCEWPLEAWNNPISDEELQVAAGVYGQGRSDLLVGAQFTDTGLLARTDLADFKVLHFATHGLVGAPRRSCQARPALLTSFGAQGSDGLLEFREIFELHLNADLVVLSACDTAGGASESATRDAGIEGGGGAALDGLVRAFIGAGSRTVIASHWPAPDDFNATFRLMTQFLGAPQGTAMGHALGEAEQALMDDPLTSHPFYWAGFALVGDGAEPVPRVD